MPRTNLGKWSVGLVPAMVLLYFLGFSLTNTLYDGVPAGGTIFADILNRPALALSMLAGFGAGISAFIVGLIGIIKRKRDFFTRMQVGYREIDRHRVKSQARAKISSNRRVGANLIKKIDAIIAHDGDTLRSAVPEHLKFIRIRRQTNAVRLKVSSG